MSTRSRYGLRAMYDVAVNQGGPVALKTIAQRQHIPEAYLERLVASLRQAELVKSVRGAQGGYELARPAVEITIGQIITSLEGSTDITDCAGQGCANVCPSKVVFTRIQQSINDVLDSMTLADMINDQLNEENTNEKNLS